MKKIKKLICMLVVLVTFTINTHAQESENIDTNIKFAVEAIIPDNQIDDKASYFHMLVEKDHTQIIKVKAVNLKNEVIEIEASANNAKTNGNGVIDYSNLENVGNATYQTPDFESLVFVKESRLKLDPYESKEFQFEVRLDNVNFEGVILGGFNFILIDEAPQSGFGQTYSYSISAALSQHEGYLKSSRTLELNNVTPLVKDGYKYLNFELDNQEANILSDLSIDVKLYDLEGTKVLFERNNSMMEISPLTRMDFGLDLGKKDLQSGTYRYVVEGTSFKQTWRWEREFFIGESEAKQVNDLSINKVMIPQLYRYLVAILFVLTLLNTVFIFKESGKKGEMK